MTGIKNYKGTLVSISAIAVALALSTVSIGTLQIALADNTVTKNVDNTGINVQTHTNQKQQCDTTGGSSPIGGTTVGSGSQSAGAGATKIKFTTTCSSASSDSVTQSGGELIK
jgi:hypothetical protein